jgi:dolichol-phosphate mannosyltransferase
MRALVVIPTYDEHSSIEEVLRRVRGAEPSADVLVVDDGSPDGTADLAEKIGKDLGQIEVLRRTTKNGLGDAYKAGFKWGLDRGYEALVEMDADLSHDPSTIPTLLGLLQDHDLVIGSRYIRGGSVPKWGVHRRLISWAGNKYSSVALGLDVHDMTSGFRAFRANILRHIELDAVKADGYGFQIEMAYLVSLVGARIVETPIRFVDRREGESKMSAAIALEALLLVTRFGLDRKLGRRVEPLRGGDVETTPARSARDQ